VWLEPRPATFLRALRVESAATLDALMVRAFVEGPSSEGATLQLVLESGGTSLDLEVRADGTSEGRCALNDPRLWSPDDPYLYVVEATLNSRDGRDEVSVPTGLRRIEVVGDELRLNGNRLYLRGVLDQGYWPDSGLSAPSPEALGRDLELARESGYNLVRKHLKLEDPRWLHVADKLGMLVWEEPPSTSRYSAASVAAFHQEVEAMVARDANHPSVVLWGLFNEEWGLDWKVAEDPDRQQIVRQTAVLLRSLDPSRPVIDNSGWSHVDTDVVDWHYYEADLSRWATNVNSLVHDKLPKVPVPLHPPVIEMKPLGIGPNVLRGRPNLNSEYGVGTTSVERAWYLKWQTQELRRHDRLSGYVYTELYDIEQEFAGIYRFDRQRKDLANLEPCEVNAETVLVLDVLPHQPGIDVVLRGNRVSFDVRVSHHGSQPVVGQLLTQWGPYLGARPSVPKGLDTQGVTTRASPFVLGSPVLVESQMPGDWAAGRLHLWLVQGDLAVASACLDIVATDRASLESGSAPQSRSLAHS